MSASNDQEIEAVIQALKKSVESQLSTCSFFFNIDSLGTVQIKLNLLIIISVHPSCVYSIFKIRLIKLYNYSWMMYVCD